MSEMKFIEDAIIDGTRRTKDGYLVAAVKCARTGIQIYLGDELGKPDIGSVRVYRPEEEVFSNDSLATYAGKPCTDNHPNEAVTSENWKDYSVGSIHEGVLREGEFVRIPITLMDKSTVDKVDNGKKEISMGYTMNLDWTPGITPQGEPYDAIQRNIRINHLAIVDKGRAGSQCRVGDGDTWATAPSPNQKTTKTPMSESLQTVTVDGLSVSTTEQGAQAITKLTNDMAALQATVDAKDSDHKSALEAKDRDLAERDAKIADLEKKQLKDSEIDKLVADRSKLLSDASKLAKDADFTGMNEADIRKAAVSAARGEDAVKDRSEAYISAAFDLALESVKDSGKGDSNFRKAVETNDHQRVNDNGQAKYEEGLQSRWKTPNAAA